MQTIIKTHKPNQTHNDPHFFILSKGNNAGKPLDKPCTNCFVVLAPSVESRDQLYWLSYGLWQARYFEPFLCGSVIPFLRLPELKRVFIHALAKTQAKPDAFSKAIETLGKIDSCEKNLTKQLLLLSQVKKALMHELLSSDLTSKSSWRARD